MKKKQGKTNKQDTELNTGNEEKNRGKQTNQLKPKTRTAVTNQTKHYTIGIVSKWSKILHNSCKQ